jgi:hypothetical protein
MIHKKPSVSVRLPALIPITEHKMKPQNETESQVVGVGGESSRGMHLGQGIMCFPHFLSHIRHVLELRAMQVIDHIVVVASRF